MSSRINKYHPILSAIDRGETIITGSRRLAREIVLHHADQKRHLNSAWERPAVFPWSLWMRELWLDSAWSNTSATPLRLLSAGRKRILWEQLIRQSGVAGGLMQLHAVAKAAVEAWDLACAWRISLQSIADLATEDASHFLEWAGAYKALCDAEHWTDEAQLPKLIAESVAAGNTGIVPEAIMLAGFDELTPAQQYFVAQIEATGTVVGNWHSSVGIGEAIVQGAPDFETELAAAARWSLDCLAADPAASIGIVVPDLAASHVKVNRIFTEIFAPTAVEETNEKEERLFSVSVGAPLLAQPMIGAALDILSLASGSPRWSMVSQILRSQFIGDAITEANSRAAFDVKFREYAGIRWPLRSLQKFLEKEEEKGGGCACPALNRRLSAALELSKRWPDRQSTRAWVIDISAWLETLGWPGERVLDSNEYQAQNRWRELLEEMAAYEDVLGDVTLSSVIGLLRNIAGFSMFKPESSRSPILVLGALEAAGLQFDHIWVTGLHDGAWPPAPAPTPFLPYSLQRSLMVPRGSAARELQFARVVLERMVASATTVKISWPQADGDEPLRASPLLDRYAQGEDVPVTNLALTSRSGEIFRQRPALEQASDGIGPGCEDGYAASGGARVLELQSLCPFRAFSELRLGARQLEQPSAGLNPRQRGQLAHNSLFHLWRAWKGQAALAAIDASNRNAQITAAIQKAASGIRTKDNPLLEQTLQIEKSRLALLLNKLLVLELQRPEFSVRMIEERRNIKIEKLRLSVRPDRIDVVAGEGHLVLDYKTGLVNPAKWLGDRPRDPQLLLYATCLGVENVRGIGFLQLRTDAVKFAGLCDSNDEMPDGIKPASKNLLASQGVSNWDELLASWKTILSRLAKEFGQGDARVDPLKGACTYCHLKATCRVEEKRYSGEVITDA